MQRCITSRHQCVAAFDTELQFFGIERDVVSDCCYEVYVDRRQDLLERLADHAAPGDREAEQQMADDTALRDRLWRGFEFPQTSTPATVFYYVTGFFTATRITIRE